MFRDWGNTAVLTNKKLTSKLCWLLTVRGFIRESDLHRIDDSKTEKRKRHPIFFPCQISRHTDQNLSLVYTYMVYKQRIAQTSFPSPHANKGQV
ncbi:hypothetical protein AYI70_g10893 [Smittium culicis]|uniref:Uncharacterized protein n=1 Tax=Smittium culicis TaxID=133412 RepID=A0A1R1X4I3_9FUNG|nr:hypothetical protein AYI70_g10893 [Smittium culicis]